MRSWGENYISSPCSHPHLVEFGVRFCSTGLSKLLLWAREQPCIWTKPSKGVFFLPVTTLTSFPSLFIRLFVYFSPFVPQCLFQLLMFWASLKFVICSSAPDSLLACTMVPALTWAKHSVPSPFNIFLPYTLAKVHHSPPSAQFQPFWTVRISKLRSGMWQIFLLPVYVASISVMGASELQHLNVSNRKLLKWKKCVVFFFFPPPFHIDINWAVARDIKTRCTKRLTFRCF